MANLTADVMAIANLLKRENFYCDTAQWDLCRATFHPNAAATYINIGWYEGNVEDFLHQLALDHDGKVNAIHSVFDPVDIRVRDNRAISETFCLFNGCLTLHGIDYELSAHMRLFSRLERLSDLNEWRLLSLEASYVRDRLAPTFPTFDPSLVLAMTNEIRSYPKGYRHLALITSIRGFKPRPGLAHEDWPASVRRLSDQNRKYLDGAGQDSSSG